LHQDKNVGAEERIGFSSNSHLGIQGLAAAGFCVTSKMLSMICGRPLYPNLAMWLQN
jgi:hypothetical protein